MKKAAWLLPALLEGSGGHRTMFQNIKVLADHGYSNDVYVEDQGQISNNSELKKQAEIYFGVSDCNLYLGFENISADYDIIFATVWFSAKVVRDINSSAKKVYFIQDFEALFHPMGDGYLMALNSYCYGLHPVTIGHWLAHKMESEFNTPAQCFDFCADKKIYRPLGLQREYSVCFVYQPDKPRRCSAIGIEALGIIKYLRPEVKIYLYGSNVMKNVWFEHENLGIISLEKCNELYNRCGVGLCISSSNPSRIPFEMMAAGLPVIDLHMENNLYDMPEGGVLLAHYTPESIAEAVISLLDDEEKREKMSRFGIEYMKDKDITDGYKQFYDAVENIISGRDKEKHVYPKIYEKGPIIADVIMNQLSSGQEMLKEIETKHHKIVRYLKRIKWLDNSRLAHRVYDYLRSLIGGKK